MPRKQTITVEMISRIDPVLVGERIRRTWRINSRLEFLLSRVQSFPMELPADGPVRKGLLQLQTVGFVEPVKGLPSRMACTDAGRALLARLVEYDRQEASRPWGGRSCDLGDSLDDEVIDERVIG